MLQQDPEVVHKHLQLLNQQVRDSAEACLNSPLLTSSALTAAQSEAVLQDHYGLLAGVLGSHSELGSNPELLNEDCRLFFNSMAPSSTFICGSQGSGKSHTLSCMLENCLFPSEAAVLSKPLTALLFHYDSFISDDGGSPCEAAYLSSLADVRVRVLCAPTNIQTIRVSIDSDSQSFSTTNIPQKTYRGLNVEVYPLQLKDSDLNTKRMLDLMGSTKEDGSTPLYIHVVHKVLREMRMNQQLTGELFNYPAFKTEISSADLTPTQLVPLFQRLAVLESFMWQPAENKKRRKRGLETYNATQWANEVSDLVVPWPRL